MYKLTSELILSICFREKKVAASVLGSRVAADDPAPCQVSSSKILITPSTEHPCAVVKNKYGTKSSHMSYQILNVTM